MARKLLDRLRDTIRTRHYSYRTEQAYVHWVRRFILFHEKRHPLKMGKGEVEAFLTYLAVNRRVAASTQNVALNAILFLYREVLEIELPWLDDVVRAKRPVRAMNAGVTEMSRCPMRWTASTRTRALNPAGSGYFRQQPAG